MRAFFSTMEAYFRLMVSNSRSSETEELNGANITDLDEAFRSVAFIESRFNSVKQSHGSASGLFGISFLLNLEGLLYVNSFLIISYSSKLKIPSVPSSAASCIHGCWRTCFMVSLLIGSGSNKALRRFFAYSEISSFKLYLADKISL